MSLTKLIIGAIAAGCLFVGGCYVAVRPAEVEVAAPEGEVGVWVEQPVPPAEVVTAAPGPAVDFLWIPGWWGWERGGWAWHGGYWGRRPHPAAVWVPHRWARGPHGGWVHSGGQWR
jgi:hypothetical protein